MTAMNGIFQCVPNFSEGRNAAVVEAIATAIRDTSGATLIDASADVDHNRCVMTILGSAGAVQGAVVAAARVAVGAIDLRRHTGVHPRVGAVDVVPIVPIRGANRRDAAEIAEAIGQTLADALNLPIYFYEDNARAGRAVTLPALRKGGFEGIRDGELTGTRAPDLGPARAHPSAGAAIVGARGPLIAYNVNLAGATLQVAQAIARRIRQERERVSALDGVRALGLFLDSRGCAQVSLNLTLPNRTPLPAVFAFVREEAAKHGVTELESEIVGVIPVSALDGQPPEAIRWRAFKPGQILDGWLEDALSADDADLRRNG